MLAKWFIGFLAVLYVFLTAAFFVFFSYFYNKVILGSILFASLFVIILILLLYKKDGINPSKGEFMRFSMHCKDCQWEWMSNISKSPPKLCPKCRRDGLEVVGWRAVDKPSKSADADLRGFLEKYSQS